MKKIFQCTALALVIGLFAAQAFAYRGDGGCYGRGYNAPPVSEEQAAQFEAFREATQDLRDKLYVDHMEMRALMGSQNPDTAKVRALAESIVATRNQIAAKAKELGIEAGPGCGFGFPGGRHHGPRGNGPCIAPDQNAGPCPGYGPGCGQGGGYGPGAGQGGGPRQ